MTGKIRPYQTEQKGRKKIGVWPNDVRNNFVLYVTDRDFAKKAENYFLIWIENKEFQKELKLQQGLTRIFKC